MDVCRSVGSAVQVGGQPAWAASPSRLRGCSGSGALTLSAGRTPSALPALPGKVPLFYNLNTRLHAAETAASSAAINGYVWKLRSCRGGSRQAIERKGVESEALCIWRRGMSNDPMRTLLKELLWSWPIIARVQSMGGINRHALAPASSFRAHSLRQGVPMAAGGEMC